MEYYTQSNSDLEILQLAETMKFCLWTIKKHQILLSSYFNIPGGTMVELPVELPGDLFSRR